MDCKKYNMKSTAVKRLMREAQELREPTEQYYAQPLEDNLFEWHFTVRGPLDSDFHGGLYHGRIILPPEYPMKPPSIILLTPNGRFELNKKICLSISGHHPESWRPSWSIRTALLAIIGFMPTHGDGAIGSLDYTPEERKILALRSQTYRCPTCCVQIREQLVAVSEASQVTRDEIREIVGQIQFKGEGEGVKADASSSSSSPEVEAELRHRHRKPEAETETVPASTEQTTLPPAQPVSAMVVGGDGGGVGRQTVVVGGDGGGAARSSTSLIFMILASLALAALLLRRAFILLEPAFF